MQPIDRRGMRVWLKWLIVGAVLVLAGVAVFVALRPRPGPAQPTEVSRQPEAATPIPWLTGTPAVTVSPVLPTAAFTPYPLSPAATAGAPGASRVVRVAAPAIQLDAPVVEVAWTIVEENGQKQSVWETASHAAGHHINSAFPGQGGNIVLSGHHNIEGEVFKRLSELKEGDGITLYTEDGRSYLYVVAQKMIVPEAGASEAERIAHAQYIGETPDERLTLVTCWPYWSNTHRVIVVARPARP